MKATEKQEGGQHYKDFVIQPVEFIHMNNLPFCVGNAIKYLLRYKNKNGLEDLNKAIHYIELIKEFEYDENGNKRNNKRV